MSGYIGIRGPRAGGVYTGYRTGYRKGKDAPLAKNMPWYVMLILFPFYLIMALFWLGVIWVVLWIPAALATSPGTGAIISAVATVGFAVLLGFAAFEKDEDET